MNQQYFPEAWYASEEKIKTPFKFIVFDDRGSLMISESSLEFNGEKHDIQIDKSNIRDIAISRQNINWVIYLIFDILTIVFIIVFSLLTGINIIVLIMLLLVLNGFGLLVGLSTKWIHIEYISQNNTLERAYFADGSMYGWAGLLGGTKKMFNSVKSVIN